MTKGVGDEARAREDAANGASHFIAGQTRVDRAAQNIISHALRRSIADACAAYMSQVEGIPTDTYGLALLALEKTYPVGTGSGTQLAQHTFNLASSPFCTSKAKHAVIGNTARKILKNLDLYVHEAATLAPGQLDQLASRTPVYDGHGREIPWDPTSAASKALWGKAGSPAKEERAKKQGRGPRIPEGSLPYPPRAPQVYGDRGKEALPSTARARSSTPPQRSMRGALAGTHHRCVHAEQHCRCKPQTNTEHRRPPASITHTAERPRSSPAFSVRATSANQAARVACMQRRDEEQWDNSEESMCARAAMHTVSLASAEATKRRDPALQQQQRSTQALLCAGQQQQQQKQQLMRLARAQLPGFVRLAPHQRVSHFYDHVRPPGSLHAFHVHMAQRSSASAGESLPHEGGGARPSSTPQAQRSASPATPAADLGAPKDIALQQQQQQEQQQDMEVQGAGSESSASRAGPHLEQSSSSGNSSGVAQSLGFFDIDDQQLLDLIVLFKHGIMAGALQASPAAPPAAYVKSGAQPEVEYLGALDAPAPPALNGTGIFNACNPNRSRRLAPTNVQLHHIRTSGALHPQHMQWQHPQEQHRATHLERGSRAWSGARPDTAKSASVNAGAA